MSKQSNRLIHETSPYLQQHAYNPVDWYPWGPEALSRAEQEDRPILLSIGYSACHWCHVMEGESFENTDIATLMNAHFICIKLDREERPDIDQIYMDAVQAMGIHGGWPLNVFLTPKQEPFYGGTYFPPRQWAQLLANIAKAFRDNRQQLDASAEKFREALNISEVKKYGLEHQQAHDPELLAKSITKLSSHFDTIHGGTAKAPKFPMPAIWNFILHYSAKDRDASLLKQLYLTLDQMAFGGIYDQIGGGFARYSVDERWFAPHFEKMLYDNSQLLSLYSLGFSLSGSSLYKRVVYQTVDFLTRELRSESGAFYSALDADSEGEEGKFYVWTYQDFQDIVGREADFLLDYYNLTSEGNWEHGQNILHRTSADSSFAAKHQLDEVWMENTILKYQEKLLDARKGRERPGLDDKIICGWNGLMIKGLTDAYSAFGDKKFLQLAVECAEFLEREMRQEDQLFRIYQTTDEKVPAYLEDYAAVIQGYLGLYQATFQERWLYKAQNLVSFTLDHFLDQEESLFFYTSNHSHKLIARKKEIFDNVIPASNSIMANNLMIIGTILQRNAYLQLAKSMIARVSSLIATDPVYLSNWAIAYSYLDYPVAEVVIAGDQIEDFRKPLAAHFHPHKILMGSPRESDLPALKDRLPEKGTMLYVCYNQTCQLPTNDPVTAIQQLTYQTV